VAEEGGTMNVTIREQRETDEATLKKLFTDEEVAKNILRFSDADSWIPEFRKSLKDRYVFAFTILADGKIVGRIRLEDPSLCRSTYRVTFVVGRQFWNQGVCTEALKQLVRFAFEELKLQKLFGGHDSDNPAAGRVFEKAGFRQEGVQRAQAWRDGRYVDAVSWGLPNPAAEDHSSEK
jgi:RimJ/RimL family protein N-acetyltransferase